MLLLMSLLLMSLEWVPGMPTVSTIALMFFSLLVRISGLIICSLGVLRVQKTCLSCSSLYTQHLGLRDEIWIQDRVGAQ